MEGGGRTGRYSREEGEGNKEGIWGEISKSKGHLSVSHLRVSIETYYSITLLKYTYMMVI